MNRQYDLVNECLELLRNKEMDTIQQLRIDVQLIQLKGLLLVGEMVDATADSFMVSLLAVCRKVSKLEGEPSTAAFEEVSRGLQRLIEDLITRAGLRLVLGRETAPSVAGSVER